MLSLLSQPGQPGLFPIQFGLRAALPGLRARINTLSLSGVVLARAGSSFADCAHAAESLGLCRILSALHSTQTFKIS
jgi:hypothetical protein